VYQENWFLSCTRLWCVILLSPYLSKNLFFCRFNNWPYLSLNWTEWNWTVNILRNWTELNRTVNILRNWTVNILRNWTEWNRTVNILRNWTKWNWTLNVLRNWTKWNWTVNLLRNKLLLLKFLHWQYLLQNTFMKSFNICPSVNIRSQVSYLYKPTGQNCGLEQLNLYTFNNK
jgi:hypothetical protein